MARVQPCFAKKFLRLMAARGLASACQLHASGTMRSAPAVRSPNSNAFARHGRWRQDTLGPSVERSSAQQGDSRETAGSLVWATRPAETACEPATVLCTVWCFPYRRVPARPWSSGAAWMVGYARRLRHAPPVLLTADPPSPRHSARIRKFCCSEWAPALMAPRGCFMESWATAFHVLQACVTHVGHATSA